MRLIFILALGLVFSTNQPGFAHHPGERVDAVMADREPDFEATDLRRGPRLDLTTAVEGDFSMSDLAHQIVILHVIADDCSAPCEDQNLLLERVHDDLSITPMRDRVSFVTLTGSRLPRDATNQARRQPNNQATWIHATPTGQSIVAADTALRALSQRTEAAPQIHIIDRGGRHAAIFHGTDFNHVNLILYVNELTNAPAPEPRMIDRIRDIFQ
ncbi:MAG: hypothetical protein ACNA7Q_09875 [Rhodobacterales bacterium]